jgi:hypothetical protein
MASIPFSVTEQVRKLMIQQCHFKLHVKLKKIILINKESQKTNVFKNSFNFQ